MPPEGSAAQWAREFSTSRGRSAARLVVRLVGTEASAETEAYIDACFERVRLSDLDDYGVSAMLSGAITRMLRGVVSVVNDITFVASRGELLTRGRADILDALSIGQHREAALQRLFQPIVEVKREGDVCYPSRMSETYDPEERRREKQASRDEDARRLAAGEITPAELGRENSPFAGLRIGKIDYSRTGLPRYRRKTKK